MKDSGTKSSSWRSCPSRVRCGGGDSPVAMSRAFPDIACRAKALVIDDTLGITIDGKAASVLRAGGPAPTERLEISSDEEVHSAGAQAGGAATRADAINLDSDSNDGSEGGKLAAVGGETAAVVGIATPSADTAGAAHSIKKSLQAARERAAPRPQGEGFGGDFISFDDVPIAKPRGIRPEEQDAEEDGAEGKKRKRAKKGRDEEGGGQEESEAALQVDKRSPWARGRRYHSNTQDKTVDLHNEVLDFVAFIKPTKSEIKRRETLVDLCRAIVNELWPTARLEVFGSYASGMYLPSSDVDMVVMGCPEQCPHSLRRLATVIKGDDNFDKIQVIDKARVPIIKWEDVPSGIPLNICFDQQDGITNTAWVKQQMIAFQPLHPLLLVLKQFLYNRDLHETYTGGVGSYLLTMTIISFLQQHPGRGPDFKKPETNIGALLMDYLHLYGLRFNMERMGISSRGGGMYFEKDSIGWDKYAIPHPCVHPSLRASRTFSISTELWQCEFGRAAVDGPIHPARPAAASRHQGRSQSWRGNFWGVPHFRGLSTQFRGLSTHFRGPIVGDYLPILVVSMP